MDDDGWDELWASDEECDHGPEEPRTDTAVGSRSGESEASELVSRICSVDVCEVFSPPRVGKEAMKFGRHVGDAMDLTTGWDVKQEEDRIRAEQYIDKEKLLVLIGSPPCVAFSQLQAPIPESERNA